MTDDELADLTKLAFFWGMHPVGMYELRFVFTQLEGAPLYAGDGRMVWFRKPLTAKDKTFTTPNATTLYGACYFDLGIEPLVVVTPDIEDRYFSVQACDQYPRWFALIGNQFTGQDAQTHLLVGPDYRGPYPDGIPAAHIHPSPSNFCNVTVRFALKSNSDDEITVVNDLMDRTSVFPMSVWEANGHQATPLSEQPIVRGTYPTIDRMPHIIAIGETLTGVDLLRMVSLVLNDPSCTLRTDSVKEVKTLQRMARLGLAPGVEFDPDSLTAAQEQVVETAFNEAKAEAEHHVQTTQTKMSGNWILTGAELAPDINDYVKQGYFGLTTIGAPIDMHSHAAAMCFIDADGEPFSGANRYTMTFNADNLPPVTEFWELPIYDTNGYFVDNPIDRYSINSFLLGRGDLHIADGKVTIYIQHDPPDDPHQAKNWLPAPHGGFRFAFRFYGPMGGLIDATYPMPAIVRQPAP